MLCFAAIIYNHGVILRKNDGGFTLRAETEVVSDYKAGLVMELQQYDREWKTIKSWCGECYDYQKFDVDVYPPAGYQYRLKLTHLSYDVACNVLDKVIDFSDIVSC